MSDLKKIVRASLISKKVDNKKLPINDAFVNFRCFWFNTGWWS